MDIAFLKPKGFLPTLAVVEISRIDLTNTDTHTIHVLLIVIYANRIALLQPEEVNRPCIDIAEFEC